MVDRIFDVVFPTRPGRPVDKPKTVRGTVTVRIEFPEGPAPERLEIEKIAARFAVGTGRRLHLRRGEVKPVATSAADRPKGAYAIPKREGTFIWSVL